MLFERLAILGVGLIGGSFARALRASGERGEIVGYGRERSNLQRAVELGVVDRYATSLAEAVRGADVVLVATPLGAIAGIFAGLRDHLEPQAVISDVGSTKGSVVVAAREHLGPHLSRFVPGHPIAGNEKSGVTAAFATLFRQRRVILTPLAENPPEAVARIRALWRAAGSEVTEMEVAHHDTVLAATSHLPHMLAYTLVDTLARLDDKDEIFGYAAGGFRDFTRIASSDPVMWRDVCLANRGAILAMIERFQADLGELAEAIAAGHDEALHKVFTRAKATRDRYAASLEAAGETVE